LERSTREHASCQGTLSALEFSRPSNSEIDRHLKQLDGVKQSSRWQRSKVDELTAVEQEILRDTAAANADGPGANGRENHEEGWSRFVQVAEVWAAEVFYTKDVELPSLEHSACTPSPARGGHGYNSNCSPANFEDDHAAVTPSADTCPSQGLAEATAEDSTASSRGCSKRLDLGRNHGQGERLTSLRIDDGLPLDSGQTGVTGAWTFSPVSHCSNSNNSGAHAAASKADMKAASCTSAIAAAAAAGVVEADAAKKRLASMPQATVPRRVIVRSSSVTVPAGIGFQAAAGSAPYHTSVTVPSLRGQPAWPQAVSIATRPAVTSDPRFGFVAPGHVQVVRQQAHHQPYRMSSSQLVRATSMPPGGSRRMG
jgi:hypothetical protein